MRQCGVGHGGARSLWANIASLLFMIAGACRNARHWATERWITDQKDTVVFDIGRSA